MYVFLYYLYFCDISVLENISNKNTISSIYIYCINKLKFDIKTTHIVFGLKHNQNNLLKLILKKQDNIIDTKLVIKYFFNSQQKYGKELSNIGKKVKIAVDKTYMFLKNNMSNWTDIYKSLYVCKTIFNCLYYTFEDYLHIINLNNVFEYDMIFFISNELVDFNTKRKVLEHYTEFINNFELKIKNSPEIKEKYQVMINQTNNILAKTLNELK